MTISINQLKPGVGLRLNDGFFMVTEYQHVKPGKGGAFVKVKLKNVKTEQVLDRTFKPGEKLEEAHLEERKLQNLYRSGDDFHFMDTTTYEETVVSSEIVADAVKFLQDNLEVTGICFKNEVLKIVLPTFIIAEVTQTEPGFKGDTSKAGTKPAAIDTGVQVQVPLFINIGDRIKIDTRSGTYVERMK